MIQHLFTRLLLPILITAALSGCASIPSSIPAPKAKASFQSGTLLLAYTVALDPAYPLAAESVFNGFRDYANLHYPDVRVEDLKLRSPSDFPNGHGYVVKITTILKSWRGSDIPSQIQIEPINTSVAPSRVSFDVLTPSGVSNLASGKKFDKQYYFAGQMCAKAILEKLAE